MTLRHPLALEQNQQGCTIASISQMRKWTFMKGKWIRQRSGELNPDLLETLEHGIWPHCPRVGRLGEGPERTPQLPEGLVSQLLLSPPQGTRGGQGPSGGPADHSTPCVVRSLSARPSPVPRWRPQLMFLNRQLPETQTAAQLPLANRRPAPCLGSTSSGNFSCSGESARDPGAAVKVMRKPFSPHGRQRRGWEGLRGGFPRQLPALGGWELITENQGSGWAQNSPCMKMPCLGPARSLYPVCRPPLWARSVLPPPALFSIFGKRLSPHTLCTQAFFVIFIALSML